MLQTILQVPPFSHTQCERFVFIYRMWSLAPFPCVRGTHWMDIPSALRSYRESERNIRENTSAAIGSMESNKNICTHRRLVGSVYKQPKRTLCSAFGASEEKNAREVAKCVHIDDDSAWFVVTLLPEILKAGRFKKHSTENEQKKSRKQMIEFCVYELYCHIQYNIYVMISISVRACELFQFCRHSFVFSGSDG